METPALERAFSFSSALADLPVITAPACPILLPVGALRPAIKAATGLLNFSFIFKSKGIAIDKKTPNIFLFDTGISIELSKGFYAEIVPRSSIINTDFFLANSIGIIDSDYRGRIFMPFRYIGDSNAEEEAQKLLHKRIGQLIIRKLEQCRIKIVKSLDDTDRGTDGFGSTGI